MHYNFIKRDAVESRFTPIASILKLVSNTSYILSNTNIAQNTSCKPVGFVVFGMIINPVEVITFHPIRKDLKMKIGPSCQRNILAEIIPQSTRLVLVELLLQKCFKMPIYAYLTEYVRSQHLDTPLRWSSSPMQSFLLPLRNEIFLLALLIKNMLRFQHSAAPKSTDSTGHSYQNLTSGTALSVKTFLLKSFV